MAGKNPFKMRIRKYSKNHYPGSGNLLSFPWVFSKIFSSEAYDVLRNTNFRWYMLGRFLLQLGLQIQTVAVGWQVYELSKDPLALGLVGLAEVIPAVGSALFAGYIVDRSDRRTILTFAQSLSVLLLAYLGCLTYMNPNPATHVKLIYCGIFVGGIARAFFATSAFAFFGQIIRRPQYVRASAWNSTLWQTASLLGPACAGFLYAALGPDRVYRVGAILALASLICILRIPKQGKILEEVKSPLLENLFQGVRFVLGHRLIFSAISLDLIGVLFGGAIALLPIFASDILKVGPQGLGILRAAPAIGAGIMVVVFSHYPPKKRAGNLFIFSMIGFGLCMLAFGFSKSFYFSVFILAMSGALDSVSVVVRSAILQLSTPDSMRGRVSAVNSIFISSSNELGAFESGVAAKLFGVIPSVILGACITMSFAFASLRIFPALRKLDISKLE
ncbi:MAG: MFS transporter [Deltaproteobacteria bacterium CG11_big_fil_rev_8_21_14_0_20_45_16]|nr:MAG: MFS transporter [Deltaproteobacteria bacterium CG11_big_fil_rev_8_21_14_0_20_45_16]